MFKNFWFVCILTGLLAACGSSKDRPLGEFGEDITVAIGINGYLWRASLDAVAELPLLSADPASGAILTDWFINPNVPNERLKVAVFVLDRALRADALKVSVTRQELTSGVWIDAEVRAGTELEIEDAILAGARGLRIQTIEKD
jgi:hypothetical protein